MRALLPLAALLLLAPAASACSLAGPVAGPGAFLLHDLDGPLRHVVPVEGRMLGAMCELSNPHALDGGMFAWVEVERLVQGAQRDLHALDLATGEARVLEAFTRGNVEEFSLWDGRAVYYEREYGEGPRRDAFVVLDLASGERRELPFPEANWVSAAIDGPVVAAVERLNGNEGPDRLWAYDAASDAWLVEGRDAREIGGEPFLWAVDTDGRWLFLEARSRPLLYELETGEVHAWHGGLRPTLLEEGYAYQTFGDLARVRLPDGAREEMRRPNGTVVSVQEGMLVIGKFSAPDLNPLGKLWWIDEPMPRVAAAAGIGLGALALGGVLWWRHRRAT